MRKFELSLASTYVQDWTLVDAVREFFQNALDQETTQPDNQMFFDYDEHLQLLSIGNKSSILTADTLLLGVTTKAGDSSTIGQFGEGYKIATLVALRGGHEVIFYNYGAKEIWKPRMVNSRKYGAKILTFFVDKHIWSKVPDNNLTITIGNVTPEEYKEIVDSNLHLQRDQPDSTLEELQSGQSSILLSEEHKGRLFVRGLYVCTNKDLHYGYDMEPVKLPLGRDRNAVRSFDILWATSNLWAYSDSELVVQLCAEGAPDVAYLANMYVTKNPIYVQTAHDQFRKTYGAQAIPVTNQAEAEKVQQTYINAKPIIVRPEANHIITSCPDYEITAEEKEKEEVFVDWTLPVILEKLQSLLEDISGEISNKDVKRLEEIIIAMGLRVEESIGE